MVTEVSLTGVSLMFLAGGGGEVTYFHRRAKALELGTSLEEKRSPRWSNQGGQIITVIGGQITRCPSPNDTLEAGIPINAPTKQLDYKQLSRFLSRGRSPSQQSCTHRNSERIIVIYQSFKTLI